MSNNWRLSCSCGAEVPEGGMNHADLDLHKILKARPQILALRSAGVLFTVEVMGRYAAIGSEWFVEHSGEGHDVRLLDESNREFVDREFVE
jgi:hypothetical protein